MHDENETPAESSYRGWRRPGPTAPGGVAPEGGESLDFLCGHFKIFQYEKGHRYSTDDVLTAWYGSQWAPRVDRAADLGSGIGSVAMIVAWRLPGASIFTIEAQSASVRLARKSVAHNGIESRFTIVEGDFRDARHFEGKEPFDLVLGTPPYFPPGTATAPEHPQAVPARNELRGDVHDYAATAARILAPGGLFAFVFPAEQSNRSELALENAGLVLLRRRDVLFREGDPPRISLFAASRRTDLPGSFQNGQPGKPVVEPPLTIRRRDGSIDPEYATIRLSFGFPPGDVGPPPA